MPAEAEADQPLQNRRKRNVLVAVVVMSGNVGVHDQETIVVHGTSVDGVLRQAVRLIARRNDKLVGRKSQHREAQAVRDHQAENVAIGGTMIGMVEVAVIGEAVGRGLPLDMKEAVPEIEEAMDVEEDGIGMIIGEVVAIGINFEVVGDAVADGGRDGKMLAVGLAVFSSLVLNKRPFKTKWFTASFF